jgi:hypothetical protein
MEAMRARKEKKYLERCRAAGIGFTALAFDTLGAAHPVTEGFLGEVFKEANRRDVCPDPRYASRAWDRVVVPLQVDVARQVLARRMEPTPEVLSVPVHLSPPVAVPCLCPAPRSFGPLPVYMDVPSLPSLLDIPAGSGSTVGFASAGCVFSAGVPQCVVCCFCCFFICFFFFCFFFFFFSFPSYFFSS